MIENPYSLVVEATDELVGGGTLDEAELRERRESVRRTNELRGRLLAKYGEMADSTEIVREDRAR